jgi:hypothetical protein
MNGGIMSSDDKGKKKTLSLGKKILFSVLAILVISIAFIATIMLTDESETELAKNWFNVEATEVIDSENNMFFHIMGFKAPEEMNSIEQAGLWVKSEQARIEALKNGADPVAVQNLPRIPKSVIFQELNELEIDTIKFIELDKLKSQSDKIYDIIERSQFLKDRYSAIANLSESECLLPKSSHTYWGYGLSLIRYHKLINSYTVLEYEKGNISSALDQLSESITLTRKISFQADVFLDKLMAHVMLDNSISSCLDILLDIEETPSKELLAFIESFSLLTREEKSFRKAMYHKSLLDINGIVFRGYGQKLLNQPNTTRNILAEKFSGQTDLSEMSSEEFASINSFSVETNFLDRLRSPLAVINASIDFTSFMDGGHHMNGKILLIKAKAEILAKNIGKDQIVQFLEKNKDTYYNIYTNEPLIWDDITNELSFYKPGETELRYIRSVKINF